MEELESFHVIMGPMILDQCLGSTPKLRHLSVDRMGTRLPSTVYGSTINDERINPKFLNNIRTLHLRGGKVVATSIARLLGSLSHLQEALLSNFRDPYPTRPAASQTRHVLSRSLKLLAIDDIAPPFFQRILGHIDIPSTTNIRIDGWSGLITSPLSSDKPRCDARTAYIWSGIDKHNVFYDHETSITRIEILSNNAEPQRFLESATPVIQTTPLENLIWLSGHPHSTFVWEELSNLRNLSFAFTPGLSDGHPTTLHFVLSDSLIKQCPRLEYIGIILTKLIPSHHPSSTNVTSFRLSPLGFKDRAELAIPGFLKSWMESYQKKFGLIRIQDDIKPDRWEKCRGTFERFIEIFELGPVSLDLPSKFGSTTVPALEVRNFQPEVNPKSSSLSADRTGYVRWAAM
jgi:hypothetical protein